MDNPEARGAVGSRGTGSRSDNYIVFGFSCYFRHPDTYSEVYGASKRVRTRVQATERLVLMFATYAFGARERGRGTCEYRLSKHSDKLKMQASIRARLPKCTFVKRKIRLASYSRRRGHEDL
jgi:hypothetical protein